MISSRIATAALIACAGAAVAQPAAPTAAKSMWNRGGTQGVKEYSTGTFDQPVDGGIRLACLPGGVAVLGVQIKGAGPAEGSAFRVITATRTGREQSFDFTAGPAGLVKFSKARTDRRLAKLWAGLRGGNNVTIRYLDGSFSVQSLAGAGTTLPARVCG